MSKITFADLSFNASNTPVSTQFDDIYFSTQDGLAETQYVFLEGNQLWEKWLTFNGEHFVIAETGFGTGLNFLAVAERFQQFLAAFPTKPLKRLYFISFEKFPLKAEQFAVVHAHYPQFSALSQQLAEKWQPFQTGCQRYHFGQIYLDLWFGDLLTNLPEFGDLYHNRIHAWFLDGFSPDKNPEMWNEKLYQEMYRLTEADGSFATFTAASHVRRGLMAAGFEVKKRKGFGKKREMLVGRKAFEEMQAVKKPYFFANSENPRDIAIVGGGVASLFVAMSLLERGKKVTLYCQDSAFAQNASGNKQGAIYPQLSDDDERNIRFYVHSFAYALQRLKMLEPVVDFEMELTGVGLAAYNLKTAEKLAKIAKQGWDNTLFEWLDAPEFSQKMGLPIPNGGAFIAQGGWLSPQQMVQNGLAYLATVGLKIVLNHRVENVVHTENGWQWQFNGETFCHEALILACGHTLKHFTQAQSLPIYPVRGEVSQTPTNADLMHLKAVLCFDGYLTPKSRENTHCLGASHVRDNAEMAFSLAEHQQNFAKLAKIFSTCNWSQNLDSSQNLAKVGIRAAFRDRLPIVGIMPNFEQQRLQYHNLYNQLRRSQAVENATSFANLYVIAGLGSRGLTSAPLLGELLASFICNEPLPISESLWHALAPNRSWMRKWLKGSTV